MTAGNYKKIKNACLKSFDGLQYVGRDIVVRAVSCDRQVTVDGDVTENWSAVTSAGRSTPVSPVAAGAESAAPANFVGVCKLRR